MNADFLKHTVFFLLSALFFLMLVFPAPARAQGRDYLTDEEIELVRDAQEIDRRINVLVKAIDRRFAAINQENWQPDKKEIDKWGALPDATPGQLLWDISKILQKAIDDIDDLAARQSIDEKVLKTERQDELDNETARILKSNNKNFPAAVHHLADASRRYLPLLEALEKKSTDKKVQGTIYGALESCRMIIEASAQIARPEPDKKKKDKGN